MFGTDNSPPPVKESGAGNNRSEESGSYPRDAEGVTLGETLRTALARPSALPLPSLDELERVCNYAVSPVVRDRIEAARVLADRGGQMFATVILDTLGADPDPMVREAAVDAAVARYPQNPDAYARILKRGLRDARQQVVRASEEGLGRVRREAGATGLADGDAVFAAERNGLMREAGMALGAAAVAAAVVLGLATAWAVQLTVRVGLSAAVVSAVGALAGWALARRLARLHALADRDGLTQLLNRNAMARRLEEEWSRFSRGGPAFAALVIDLDHLKQLNDSGGHHRGDRAIREVAHALRKACRLTDIVGRTGGDEFVVIAPSTNSKDAMDLADRILDELKGNAGLTLSCGLATASEASSMDALIELADARMYAMKRAGGDAIWRPTRRDVALASSPTTPPDLVA